MSLKAGSLKHKLYLQSPVQTQSTDGTMSASWTTVATIWGNIRALSGAEAIRAGAPTAEVACSIRIRPRMGVSHGQRLLSAESDGRIYDIQAVLFGDDHFDLVCTQGANNG